MPSCPPCCAKSPRSERSVPPYAAVYRALAAEQEMGGARTKPRQGQYLELFGIFPNFSVLRARLTDDARHVCDQAVDRAPLASYSRNLGPDGPAVMRGSEARRAAEFTLPDVGHSRCRP